MKTLSFIKKSLYSALVFFGTLLVLSAGYATWNATMAKVSSGSTLSSNNWNSLVDNISDLDSRWSRNGAAVVFTGGNVGIGTISPAMKLDISSSSNGAARFSVNSSNGSAGEENIRLKNTNGTNGNTSGIMALNSSDGYTSWIDFINVSNTQPTGALSFSTNNNGVYGQRMYIDQTGNVGIGTTSPTERLDLGGGNIRMGWERISTACSNTTPCTATCSAGKMATGGGCLISNGVWTRIESSAGDNSYTCYYETPPIKDIYQTPKSKVFESFDLKKENNCILFEIVIKRT